MLESISKSLQPYKDIIGQVASIVTIAQFFSGGFVCKDIFRKRSTKGVSSTPFIGGVVIGILMLKLAIILGDPAMYQVNVAAIFLNSIYTLFYLLYSRNKMEEVYKPAAIGVAVVAAFLGYATVENPMNLEYRYGLLVTILLLLLIAAPLADLKGIIAKKDASSIPFPLTLMGSLVSCLWLTYGIVIMNGFMIVQNFIGLVLCIFQLYLIFEYPGQPSKKKQSVKID